MQLDAMNVKRTLTFGVGGGALAVWLAAAATSPPPPSAPIAATPPAAIDRSGAELSTEIARLRERLRPSAQPAQARDLFRYRARAAAQSAAAAAARDSALALQLAPQQLLAPSLSDVAPLKLVGMAEDPGDAGPIRSAILSGFGDLFIVKAGDSIAGRYRVAAISADNIDLVDVSTNAPLRIPVK
jgi:hypothetical protein